MREIKLDYDGIEFSSVCKIFYHRAWLLKRLDLDLLKVYYTKKGYHIRAWIRTDISDEDVILVQILLGSDIHREIYNFLRKLDGQLIRDWNKLFTKKYAILGLKLKPIGKEKFSDRMTEKLLDIIERSDNLEGGV